ncbi:hypothetical protein GC087_06010 [Pantoea sp. JZ2]|uniref:hypothetical protein n=1 Tax=Pantoea sp. JZ2 TaxID=2654189 RepID=UPI002B49A177|nr:hypothetical protein [Pantoea sp. JZ2]WRH12198.1 hypothetical protein GC087_06010 [Pantoea sp. JZ2]
MNDFLKKLDGMVLPSWMNKGEPQKLLKAAQTFWKDVHDWVTWPLRQSDPLTCNETILGLIAWDRDISRFNGEPLKLFRRRVAYAFVNAADAGSVAGFINIFDRLGIGYVELLERQPGIDWDVIRVRVTDSQIADNTELMIQIIRQYGRTCRRYQFEVITSESLAIRGGWDQGEYIVYPASIAGTETSSATFSASLQGE